MSVYFRFYAAMHILGGSKRYILATWRLGCALLPPPHQHIRIRQFPLFLTYGKKSRGHVRTCAPTNHNTRNTHPMYLTFRCTQARVSHAQQVSYPTGHKVLLHINVCRAGDLRQALKNSGFCRFGARFANRARRGSAHFSTSPRYNRRQETTSVQGTAIIINPVRFTRALKTGPRLRPVDLLSEKSGCRYFLLMVHAP